MRSKVVEAEAEAKLMVAKGIMAHLEIVGGLLTNHTTGKSLIVKKICTDHRRSQEASRPGTAAIREIDY